MSRKCVGLALGLVLAFVPVVATAADPSPSEWSGSKDALEYLGEVSFGGPNLAGLPPLGPEGVTMIGRVDGGTATGPVLNGEIMPVGEDWAVIKPDGNLRIDVKLLLKTRDGAYIKIRYEGRWQGTDATRKDIILGKEVAPTAYYLRSAPFFETTDPRYAYLNNVVAIGFGRVERGAGATMRIYRVR